MVVAGLEMGKRGGVVGGTECRLRLQYFIT